MRMKMLLHEEDRGLPKAQLSASGGDAYAPGVYQSGPYKEEAKAFFLHCVGEDTYDRAMNSEAGRRHHYVAARAFLNQGDWEKFCWIEQHGSLENYPF